MPACSRPGLYEYDPDKCTEAALKRGYRFPANQHFLVGFVHSRFFQEGWQILVEDFDLVRILEDKFQPILGMVLDLSQ
jgi:hypothetical protein